MVQLALRLGIQNYKIWDFFSLSQLLLVVCGGKAAKICMKFNVPGVLQ